MRILVIEDNEAVVDVIKRGLESEGFAVDCLLDGALGERRILMNHGDYDAIILDLMLPKVSGFDVCKHVREAEITVPILILTARDGVDDKVTLLDSGADDYLVKPFEMKELFARIRALTRRPVQALPTELVAGRVRLNPATKKVFSGDHEIKMPLTEFRLLEYLMRNPSRVITRDEISDHVWDFNFDSFSNVVDVYVNRLRKKLDNDRKETFIETARGSGYKIRET